MYGQVYEPGLTPNASAPIIAQLGVGPESADPGYGWTWSAAPFSGTVGNNNEFARAISATAGASYAFRYTVDGGVWCYGDLDGSQNGFSGGANVGLVIP